MHKQIVDNVKRLSMLPTDLLLKTKINLYDNAAQLGDCPGRLSAELQISPSPQIHWDFQVIGSQCSLPDLHLGKEADISASWFRLGGPLISGHGTNVNSKLVRGSAIQAWYGDPHSTFHQFAFYLPNTRFCEKSWEGQKLIEATIEERNIGSLETTWLGHHGEARSIEAKINDKWAVRLVTGEDALNWLSPVQANVGTLLTTEAIVYPACVADTPRPEISSLPTLTLLEAEQILNILATWLSFANGGYLMPLYIEGKRYSKDLTVAELPAATAVSRLVTPLEDLGNTWLNSDSNLSNYIQCLPTLQKMLSAPPWDQAFPLILAWYFQAIQPIPGLSGWMKDWPIAATAIGAALERLAYAILVQEEPDADRKSEMGELFKQNKSRERLRVLLERAGLHQSYGDHVQEFVYLRNEAVHPKPGSVPEHRRRFLLDAAIEWVEELILWRLGYDGKYLHRIASDYCSTEPRYDLTKRDSSW